MSRIKRPRVLNVNSKAGIGSIVAPPKHIGDDAPAIGRGLLQALKGLGRPVDDVFEELERED